MRIQIILPTKSSPLFSLLYKTPSICKPSNQFQQLIQFDGFFFKKQSNFCTATAVIKDALPSKPMTRKEKKNCPENVLKFKVGQCSKYGDVAQGVRLYDEARLNGTPLNLGHYNPLLYMCSTSQNVDKNCFLDKGFEIFKQMVVDKVVMAARKEDPEMAFGLVKRMVESGVEPKLRSYGPALFGFCKNGLSDKAYEHMEWLQRHGPFDAVVDGANVSFINQKFNFSQLDSVVNELRQLSPSKRLPLVILHDNRANFGPARHPANKRLLDRWNDAGALYVTPIGSNDDWYWLYAAVTCNSLLVTNDEMRDHLFQLLGTSFFPRWKEKHQARLAFSNGRHRRLVMPPPYSNVIQELEQGSWYIPTVIGDDLETPRQWLCATRSTQLQ